MWAGISCSHGQFNSIMIFFICSVNHFITKICVRRK